MKYETTCPYCGETREIGASTNWYIKNGKHSGRCRKCYSNSVKPAENIQFKRHNVTCPECMETRKISDAMLWHIKQGNTTSRCKLCFYNSRKVSEKAKPKRHKITCPDCKQLHEVSAPTASNVRNGKRMGLCPICTIQFRKTQRNDGQFSGGLIPWNKGVQFKSIELKKERKKKWNYINFEKLRNYAKSFYNKNKDICKLRNKVCRYRRRTLGTITTSTIMEVTKKHRHNNVLLCYICKSDCTNKHEIDHIIPVCKGGRNDIENLAIACPSCNRRKSSRSLEVFLAEINNSGVVNNLY